MAIQKQPYFMENEEWYEYDNEKGKYILTEKAPQEAVDSYNDFYSKVGTRLTTNFTIDDILESQAMNLFGLRGDEDNNGK